MSRQTSRSICQMVKKVVKCLCLILHYHVQESLFGEIVFDDDFHKIKKLNDDINDYDDHHHHLMIFLYM